MHSNIVTILILKSSSSELCCGKTRSTAIDSNRKRSECLADGTILFSLIHSHRQHTALVESQCAGEHGAFQENIERYWYEWIDEWIGQYYMYAVDLFQFLR